MIDDGSRILYAVLCIIIVGSSLFARGLPMKHLLKMSLAWVGIFAGVFGVLLFKPEFEKLWNRIKIDAGGAANQAGGSVALRMSDDGHFYAPVQINGVEKRMLVDSGASSTGISAVTARQTGIETEGAFPVVVQTANGRIMMQRGTAKHLQLGSISRDDFPVLISDQDDLDIIGMNFLSSLKSWRVEGDKLIMVP